VSALRKVTSAYLETWERHAVRVCVERELRRAGEKLHVWVTRMQWGIERAREVRQEVKT
jgi:hypothetical protein